MILHLFIPGIPKNSNASSQWAKFAAAKDRKTFRSKAKALATESLPPDWTPAEHSRITARHIYTVRRRRDPLGLAERLKGIMDGLVDAGVIPDDDENHITVILERSLRGDEAGIQLTIAQE
jgi:hypothetical protein